MTHPDILTTERLGSLYHEDSAEKIGECLYCEATVYDSADAVESVDGLFCDMECCHEYYGIQKR